MLVKLSVDQALMKANSHLKKDEILEAQKLYQAVLLAFPKNIRAQQGLTNLNKIKLTNTNKILSRETINHLINLYNQGQLSSVIEHAHELSVKFPGSFDIWNILGTAAIQIKMLDKAIEAYEKCVILKPDYAEGYNNMGVALKEQGKFLEAINLYKKSISLKPNFAEAYVNIGVAFKELGKLDDSIDAYNKAITIKPDHAQAYSNLGNALQDKGMLNEAIDAYQKSISIKPNNVTTFINMGNTFRAQGKLDDAILTYKKSLSYKPNYNDAYLNIGTVLLEQSKLDEAIKFFNKCISLNPNYVIAHNNLGNALYKKGKFNIALEAYQQCIFLDPNYFDAYYNMAIALAEQNKLNEALNAYHKVLIIKPDHAEAYNNMGEILRDLGRLDESIDVYKKCIKVKSNHAEAYSNMGMTLQYQDKLEEAIHAYNKAILINPDYHIAQQNLSYALLNSGKLKEGLDKYECRWKKDNFVAQQRHFSQPFWDGKKSLKGKRLLLWSEQGVGDTINWSSCINYIVPKAKYCILECQEKLIPLLRRSFPEVDIRPENRSLDTKRDDFDFHLPMGSLYRCFLENITHKSKPDAFLIPDPTKIKYWKRRLKSLGNGPYVGISWKSSQMSIKRIPNYSCISEWSQILKIPDVTFINLQYVDFENDLKKVSKEFGVTVHNFDDLDHYDDIDDVAALCAALDMVVSNKTTVPLISTGVGTSTKLASWRQSSWNNIITNPVGPSIEIFERNTWEPWDKVFNLIAKDVLKLKKIWSK